MRIIHLGLAAALLALAGAGCSTEKVPEQTAEQKTIILNASEQEKIQRFLQELAAAITLPDKTFSLVTQELAALVTGNWNATRLTGLMETAGKELVDTSRRLTAIAIPEGVPPEIKQRLQKMKEEAIAAAQFKSDSLAALKRALEEKKPTVLLEFRKQMAEAAKQLEEVRQKMKKLQQDSGITI